MLRNRLFPAVSTPVAAAVVAGALALTGCAAPAAPTNATETSATRAAAVSGQASIMVYSVNSDGPDFRALVTGAVGDYGPAVTVRPDGTVDPTHTSEMELKLTHGSFRLSIADIGRKFVQVLSHEPIYPRTCSDFANVTGLVPIVAGSGTGAYRGISGDFHVALAVNEVEKKPCQPANGFQWQVITLTGHGTISHG